MSIRRIRLTLKEGRYEYSIHALEEMDEDGLDDLDVYEALMRGRIARSLAAIKEGRAS